MPAQRKRPGVTTTRIVDQQAAIERHELSVLSKEALVDLFRSIKEVVCVKEVTEDGKPRQVGIQPDYMEEKFDHLLAHNLEYGEEKGVKRTAKFVYVYKNAKIDRRGDIISTSGEPIAFALVCSPGPIFHRLRPRYVANSVYLAMLCGSNATALYREVLREARENGKVVTLDSLPHVITYYLRPEFGTAVAIDTEVAFDASRTLQNYFIECRLGIEKLDENKMREYRDSITREIAPGEKFVPVSESSARGHEKRVQKDRTGYMQAHIVVFDSNTDEIDFDTICMPDSSAQKTMEPYDHPPRGKRNRDTTITTNTSNKERRVQFGANIEEEPYAVSKYNEKLTIDMDKMNGLTQNGDYRLVHSTAKAEPSAGLTFAWNKINEFKNKDTFLSDSMHREKGTVQRALAELYKKDKKNLRVLIRELIRY